MFRNVIVPEPCRIIVAEPVTPIVAMPPILRLPRHCLDQTFIRLDPEIVPAQINAWFVCVSPCGAGPGSVAQRGYGTHQATAIAIRAVKPVVQAVLESI